MASVCKSQPLGLHRCQCRVKTAGNGIISIAAIGKLIRHIGRPSASIARQLSCIRLKGKKRRHCRRTWVEALRSKDLLLIEGTVQHKYVFLETLKPRLSRSKQRVTVRSGKVLLINNQAYPSHCSENPSVLWANGAHPHR